MGTMFVLVMIFALVAGTIWFGLSKLFTRIGKGANHMTKHFKEHEGENKIN